uniref:G_PROTEIN_RECEP_F1_2 domain-containing protein n=1 Tax=Parastrongyloides trichosuri TaxID=131310 RepID=A0A0N4ZXY8_PARTI
MDFQDYVKTFMFIGIYTIGFFGTFGNINIIVAILKNKAIQTKCGIMVGILAFVDTINILSEFSNATFVATHIYFDRKTCFNIIGIYIATIEFDVFFMLSLAVDRFLALYYPVKYKNFDTFIYVSSFTIFSLVPGFILLILGALNHSNPIVLICNPITALQGYQVYVWNFSTVFTNLIIIFVYIVSYIGLKIKLKKSRNISRTGKVDPSLSQYNTVMKTMSIIVIIFCCSWFVAHTLVLSMLLIKIDDDVASLLASLGVLPAMICYSANYYIYFCRSKEYRNIFCKQLIYLFPCMKSYVIPLLSVSYIGDNKKSYVSMRSRISRVTF